MNNLWIRILAIVVSISMISNIDAAEKKAKPQTRTFISGHCLLSENDAPPAGGVVALILAALVPKAINWTIDFAVEKLTKIKKDESSSTNRFYLYTFDSAKHKFPVWNPYFGCMTSITAVFHKNSLKGGLEPLDAIDYKTAVDLNKPTPTNNLVQRLNDNGILIGEGGLYSIYEAKLDFAEDASAYRIVSRYLQIDKLLSGSKKAGQVYAYRLDGPGSSPDSETYTLATIDLGEVTPGTKVTLPNFKKGKSTGWIRRTGMSKNSLVAFISERPDRSGSSVSRRYTPVKLSVSNTQTKKPSDGAKLVAAVLKALKETITSSVTEAVSPKDEDAEATKLLDAKIAVAEANAELQGAAAGSTAEDIAQLKLDKACIALKALGETTCP